MAYTVPQFRLFQEFTETLASSTSSLSAVIIAPHYGVHRYEEDDEKAYITSAGQKLSYDPAGVTAEYPNKTVGGIVDTDSVLVYLEDAPVVYNTLNISSVVSDNAAVIPTEGGNRVSTNLVLHSGNGFVADVEYEVGDTVVVTPTSGTAVTAKILSFIATNVPSTISDPEVSGTEGTTSSITKDSNAVYAGTEDNAYVVVIAEDVTVTEEADPTIKYTTYDTAGIEDTTSTTVTGKTLMVGTKGVRIVIGNGTLKAGTIITINVTAEKGGKYSDVVLDTELTGIGTTSTGTVKLCRANTFALKSSEYTAARDNITLAASITFDDKAVLGGYMVVDYRERLSAYTNTVGELYSAADVEKTLGPAIAENPLSLMVYQALLNSNGTVVFFVAVANDTVSGYSDALNVIEGVSDIYSIVPYATTDDIQDLVFSYVKEHASPTLMDWKIAWFGCDVDNSKIVLSKLLNGSPLVVSVDGYVATVQGSADLSVISAGDTLYVTSGTGTYQFTVDYQVSENSFRIVEGSLNTIVGPAYVEHKYTPSEIANIVAAKSASFNHRRVRNVYADGVYATIDANTNISNAYVAAACAGLRSASAPHQPLTRVELNGFVLVPEYNFGSGLLNEMAEGGTWIVTNDAATVYIRHQLTTDTTNYNLREDSKTTNADEISRYYRDNLSDYYGRVNISPEFISYLETIVDNISYSIASRVYPVTLGPQILSFEPCEITVSDTLSDALTVRVTMDTPEPLNYLDVYLTIS